MIQYMGSKSTTQTSYFKNQEDSREIAVQVSLLPTRLQVNPILAAISLLHIQEDIDRITIPAELLTPSLTGMLIEDITPDQMKFTAQSLVVERDKLLLNMHLMCGLDEEEVVYDLPRGAFIQDLLNFLGTTDTTFLNPPPIGCGYLYMQRYVDNNGDVWDQTDDPLRFSTKRMKEGDDFCGWLEDGLGRSYFYADYQHEDDEDENVYPMEFANIYLTGVRDPKDDTHIVLSKEEDYQSLVLTRDS